MSARQRVEYANSSVTSDRRVYCNECDRHYRLHSCTSLDVTSNANVAAISTENGELYLSLPLLLGGIDRSPKDDGHGTERWTCTQARDNLLPCTRVERLLTATALARKRSPGLIENYVRTGRRYVMLGHGRNPFSKGRANLL